MRTIVSRVALVLAAVLAGCAVGPNYRQPAALTNQPLPKTFTGTVTNGVVWKIAEPSANLPRGEWWQFFSDPELNRLETLAATNNQNLVAAAARFEQARALAAEARADFYPQLNAGGTPGGDVTRQRTSASAPSQGQAAGQPYTYDTFTAPIYLGWELDLWGRVRRQSEAARARFIASADDRESAKLDLAAEIADDYFTLRALDNG